MEFKSYEGMDQLEVNANGEIRWVDTKKAFDIEVTARNEVRIRYLPSGAALPRIVSAAKVVATLFVPNPNGYRWVKSLDGDKLNLNSSNLVWVPGPRCKPQQYVP